MTSPKAADLSSTLVTTWWRQHGLAGRLKSFRAARQPTPRRLPLERTADGGVSPVWAADVSGVTTSSSTTTPACSPRIATARGQQPDLPVILVSACLLSYPVTYRGPYARLPALLRPTPLLFLTEVLFKELGLVHCIPVCPEVQWLGLPVPRVPLRLVRGPRARDNAPDEGICSSTAPCNSRVSSPPMSKGASSSAAGESGRDVRYLVDSATEDRVLLRYSAPNDKGDALLSSPQLNSAFLMHFLHDLNTVDGIILKSYSPSCGVQDARLYEAPAPQSSSSLCHQHACNACGRAGKPTSTSLAGRRPDASTSAPRRFELVDGFFTHQLRRFLDSAYGLGGGQQVDSCSHPGVAVPVITCDRLLTHFYAEEHCNQAPSTGRGIASSSEAVPDLTYLDRFMESVLRHRHWRLSRGRC
ncbi:hypothetical protein JKF63_05550 [Porcisia hertigi]|uniref:DUF523 domain-containing protein n=1 Tax=Porcisia hertigi TaxID=2761500 RepID=A0A836IQN1_9TRYP|nr:hypothetical protein JKF63_05550 [Porcisia hertigi]